MRTVAVISRKGGSGKTTIAVHLAIGFHLRGRKTLLADADPQQSSMEVFKARIAEGPKPVVSSGVELLALQENASRSGFDALVIDTPAVLEDEVAQAVVLADLALLVVRPTLLDLLAAARTSDIVRRLRKPGFVVLNQAPVARENVEAPIVRRSIEALGLLKLPAAPCYVRTRAGYQVALETGRSVEEVARDSIAGREMGEFCDYIDRFLFAGRADIPASRSAA